MQKEKLKNCPYLKESCCNAFDKNCVDIDKCNNKLLIKEKENEQNECR